jgi:hypothetical protein
MIAPGDDASKTKWTSGQCPFQIEFDSTAMDDIRLAVVDAFFSLPRGGAEIGGILLGEYAPGRLTISGYQALECEHAFGPSFALSPNDLIRLADMIRSTPGGGADVVGWYHSHTRSEILLSDADLEIHNRYFPEPWQVALVMKPSAFKPARVGFFFRDSGGRIRTDSAWEEFELQPLAAAPAPAPGVEPPGAARRDRPLSPRTAPQAAPEPEPGPEEPPAKRHVLTLDTVLKNVESADSLTFTAPPSEPPPRPRNPRREAPIDPESPAPTAESVPATRSEPAPQPQPARPAVASPSPDSEPAPAAVPAEESASGTFSGWYWLLVACLVGVLVYQTREYWMGSSNKNAPPVTAGAEQSVTPSTPAAPAPVARSPLALGVTDAAGHLQIRWDAAAPAARDAVKGTLEIADGERRSVIPLDGDRLRAGVFTYARESQSVDVKLAVEDGAGKRVEEKAAFYGKLPEHPPADAEAAKQRDELAKEVEKLKAALAAQTERANKLERTLEETRRQSKRDQQRRRQNQTLDPLD